MKMKSIRFSESWLVGPQETQFYTRTYSPPSKPKAVVVFVHGFAEHIARYEHVFPAWSTRDIAVFAYDQRGFGRTALDEEKKSNNSSYSKTTWREQFEDIRWAIKHAKSSFPSVPVFLYGHSMGGALVLAFATGAGDPNHTPETGTGLAGVIASSPFLRQTKPAAKLMRWLGSKASKVMPSYTISVDAGGQNGQGLSHDEAVGLAYMKDPLVKQVGTLALLRDMLDGGEHLLHDGYTRWPRNLPFLVIHGSDDKVTSPNASELFHESIKSDNKKLSIYEGGYHELHNELGEMKNRFIEESISWVEAQLKIITKL